jgi:hypothetical protein
LHGRHLVSAEWPAGRDVALLRRQVSCGEWSQAALSEAATAIKGRAT